jgi:hypothetical protein
VSFGDVLLVSMLAALTACGTRVGSPCANDAECGSGFDCYRDACTRVCTGPEQCDAGEQCVRYHCLLANGAVPGAAAAEDRATARRPSGPNVSTGPGGAPVSPAPPVMPPSAGPSVSGAGPLPNTTAAELRAIRRELEIVREQQAKILELLESGKAKKK